MSIVLRPEKVGAVTRLSGLSLRADADFDGAGRFATGWEVEVAPKADAGSEPDWANPVWSAASDGCVRRDGRRRRLGIVSIDSLPVANWMRVGRQRPRFLICSSAKVSAYDWELFDGDDRLDGATDVTKGISSDGLWVSFRPEQKLRRTGGRRKPKLGAGVFKPPFEVPRDQSDTPRRYKGISYPGHSSESIDFNRGTGDDDRGDPVYAAADGTVVWRHDPNGEVHIAHADGWKTVYAHMDPIHVSVGDRVTALTRIGRVSDAYFKSASISPHIHHQQSKDGVPKPMRFDGRRYRLGSRSAGWRRSIGKSQARMRIRVKRANGWSNWREVRFRVASAAAERRPSPEIDIRYDGPEPGPGKYAVRYRVTDDQGVASDWAQDDFTIHIPDEPPTPPGV